MRKTFLTIFASFLQTDNRDMFPQKKSKLHNRNSENTNSEFLSIGEFTVCSDKENG